MERSIMTQDDLNRTFQDTYLSFKTRDDDGFFPARVLAAVARRDIDNRPSLLVQKANEDRLILPIYNDKLVKVNYSWPKLGAINTNNGVIWTSRKAQRQWKRGLRASLINSQSISQLLNRGPRSAKVKVTRALLDSLYNPKYYNLRQAISILNNQRADSVALSPAFSIAERGNQRVIFFSDKPIGFLEGTQCILEPEAQNLQPYLQKVI